MQFDPNQQQNDLAGIFANPSNNFSTQIPGLPRLGVAPAIPAYSGAMNNNAPKSNNGKGQADAQGVMNAMKSASQDNNSKRLSSAGEKSGVKFKHDNDGHATGSAAFDTLDAYMKKAGLNSFQASFFSRMISEAVPAEAVRAAIKSAGDKFGEKVAEELQNGFEKISYVKAIQSVAPALKKKIVPAAKSLGDEGIGAAVGAFNPATGLGSSFATNPDGSINYGRLAGSTLGGAAGIGTAKRLKPQVGSSLAEHGRAALSGEGIGFATDVATGSDSNLGSQIGFAAGAGLPSRVPQALQRPLSRLPKVVGLSDPSQTKNVLEAFDPLEQMLRAGRKYPKSALIAAPAAGAANRLYQDSQPDQSLQAILQALPQESTPAASTELDQDAIDLLLQMYGGEQGLEKENMAKAVPAAPKAPAPNLSKPSQYTQIYKDTLGKINAPAAPKAPAAAQTLPGKNPNASFPLPNPAMRRSAAPAQAYEAAQVRESAPQRSNLPAQAYAAAQANQQTPATPAPATPAPAAPSAPAQSQQPAWLQTLLSPEVLPYLLGAGGGAGLGYLFGGGRGAALGGLAVPLMQAMYARSQGQANPLDSIIGKSGGPAGQGYLGQSLGIGGLLGGFGAPAQKPPSAADKAVAEQAVAPIGQEAAPAEAQPPAEGTAVPTQTFENLPGDTDGDGQLSPEEGAAVGSNPELLGQMVNHPQALDLARQQYASNPDFKAKVDKIKKGMNGFLAGMVPGEVARLTKLSPKDSQMLIDLAMQI